MILSEITIRLEEFWPVRFADDWDRPGLSVGNSNQNVSRVLITVDVTNEVIDEAISKNCQLIIAHHPLLLRGITSAVEDQLKGSLIAKLIRSNIAVFSAHTNADVQVDGASTLMAKRFGLKSLRPLIPAEEAFGHGVIGELVTSVSLSEFAGVVSATLNPVARKIAFAGDPNKIVKTVAICSGAGDGFLETVLESAADVYVTSDLRHHVTSDALLTPRDNGSLALIDVSHWAAESLWVIGAIERLSVIAGVDFIASEICTDPWTAEVG